MTDEAAWEAGTWEGSRRAQLRRALRLTVRERLLALEELAGGEREAGGIREGGAGGPWG